MLGYIVGDGNNYNNTVQIASNDYECLVQIRNAFEWNGPFQELKPSSKNKLTKPIYKLFIGSKQMCERLKQLHCPPNKTFLTRIAFNEIPDNLMNHYLRGLLDSEGTVSSCSGHPYMGWSGNNELMRDIYDYLKTKDIASYVYKHGNISICRIAVRKDVVKVFKYLYKDAHIFMKRKRVRFRNTISYYVQSKLLENKNSIMLNRYRDYLVNAYKNGMAINKLSKEFHVSKKRMSIFLTEKYGLKLGKKLNLVKTSIRQ